MAKNTAQVNINFINQAFSVSPASSNIAFVIGETLRGLDNNPKEVITSEAHFERAFGGTSQTNPFPEMCKQALRAGALLRVCRVVGDGAAISESANFATSTPVDLFKLQSLEKGAHTEDLEAVVSAASSGEAGEFNLTITDTGTGKDEVYENLKVTGGGAAGPYNYLKPISDSSRLVKPVYLDISGAGATLRPVDGTKAFTGGADGAAPDIADYIGVAGAKTGFYAFDNYDDAYMLYAFGKDESNLTGIAAAGASYAKLRQDLVYLQHVDNTLDTAVAINSEISGAGASTATKFMGFIGGGMKAQDLIAGGVKDMPNLGELAGVIATTHDRYGVWASPTNLSNGTLPTALGVTHNFGSPAAFADLNLLSNGGANMVIQRYGSVMLWDFYSRAVGESPEKFLTVVLAQIFLSKSLKPFLDSFLTKPNIPSTWSSIYYGVKPFLDGLVGTIFTSYEWTGDQFVGSVDSVQFNDPVEIGQGKYKAQLKGVMVVPMVEFTLDIVMTRTQNQVVIQ